MSWAIKACAAYPAPFFIRAGRAKAPVVYQVGQTFEIGKAVELVEGSDIALIGTGLMVAEAIKASEILDVEGVSARVVDFHTIKPLDREAIARAAETGAIVVAEEHLKDSGLGVRVAQAVSETRPCVMEFVGLDTYAESGTPDGLLDKYGLRAANIAAAARRALSRRKR